MGYVEMYGENANLLKSRKYWKSVNRIFGVQAKELYLCSHDNSIDLLNGFESLSATLKGETLKIGKQ